jgi:protein phosphatase
VLVLLGVLGGGLWLGYQYTQKQYYVGATEAGQLAIFRGVPGEIAGLDLSNVNETSPSRLDDLTVVAQERVKEGIHADDRPDAQRMIAELTDDVPTNPNLKPLCIVPTTAPAPTSAPPVAPSAGASNRAGSTALPGSTTTRPTANGSSVAAPPSSVPTSTPSAQASESAPAADPAGCRTVN